MGGYVDTVIDTDSHSSIFDREINLILLTNIKINLNNKCCKLT
jgi:hypothetical protein